MAGSGGRDGNGDGRKKKKRKQKQGRERERKREPKERRAQKALVFSASEVDEFFAEPDAVAGRRKHVVYMIFSSRKMTGENFWNMCASRVANSDTIHAAILFDDGYQCSINTITDAVTMTRISRLEPVRGALEAERNKSIYQFTVSERTYINIQEKIRAHIRNQTSYDIFAWYVVGVFGTCFNPNRVGARAATANTVTCSRLFYDILRDPEVGILDAQEADDGILPHQLKELVEQSSMGAERASIASVNRRLAKVGSATGVIIADQA